ncbi:lytic transglycosylase domain-containing protein [Buttiauxella sp. 3AFRM03]|nr:lytic transglycosylase domain-containing protein [Buttiauxella sp. 3AFRM03]
MSAIAEKESSWNPLAINKESGAAGLFQFMPGTAKGYGLEGDDVFDPNKATIAAAKYLQDNMKCYDGDIAKSLTQYNGGRIDKEGRGSIRSWLNCLPLCVVRHCRWSTRRVILVCRWLCKTGSFAYLITLPLKVVGFRFCRRSYWANPHGSVLSTFRLNVQCALTCVVGIWWNYPQILFLAPHRFWLSTVTARTHRCEIP